MPLREYQEDSLRQISQQWRGGRRAVVLVLPTGGGKTAIAAEAIRRTVARGKKAIFLAHRRELINQASERFKSENIPHGILMAGKKTTEASVQIGSVDTFRARNLRPEASLVIWDECHHTVSDTWEAIHADYKDAHHLGLTATPCRYDGKGLGDVFDSMVVGATVEELTALGFLVPCEVEAPKERLSREYIAQDPVQAYLSRCAGEKALVYAASVEEAHALAARFLEIGIKAGAIDGTTKAGIRDDILKKFLSGELQVLCNMSVLTEGFDVPDATVCIVARPIGHVGLWLQILGRVLRPATGKARALVIDLHGSVHAHGLPDDPRVYSLEGNGIVAPQEDELIHCNQCGNLLRNFPCRRCGFIPRAKEEAIIINQPLVSIRAKLSRKDEIQVLDDLLRDCLRLGYKPGWIFHSFKRKYDYAISGYKASLIFNEYNRLLELSDSDQMEII